MRAIRVHIDGEDLRLQMEEVPRQEPRPDQVLVRVSPIGVNRADLGRGAAGRGEANDPFIPGLDIGGTIEEVDSEVTRWKDGGPVIALVRGCLRRVRSRPRCPGLSPPLRHEH